MAWVPPLAGALLLGALFTDVFLTVFVPRGGPGLVTDRLYRSGWGLWRRVSRLAPRNERSVLALGGPLLLPATVVLWALELVFGFALIYLPFAQQFQVPGEVRPSAATLSLYVSAYSATTLGVGDVHPADSVLRLLSTLEAAMGFALFTVSIAYLLSVYNALRQATSLALEISHFVGRHAGEDPVDLIERMTRSGAEAELTRWVAHTTAKLASTQQAAAQYPLIHYFHVPDDDQAFPLAVADLLELLTICRAVLDPRAFPGLACGPTTLSAYRTATGFVASRAEAVRVSTRSRRGDAESLAGYQDVRRRLVAARVPVRQPDEAGWVYVSLRQEWDHTHDAVRRHFGYPAVPYPGHSGSR